jgi:hypothetical protein
MPGPAFLLIIPPRYPATREIILPCISSAFVLQCDIGDYSALCEILNTVLVSVTLGNLDQAVERADELSEVCGPWPTSLYVPKDKCLHGIA